MLKLKFYIFLERVYEEHELLVDNLMLWTRDSKNRLLFVERPERTLIFENPWLFNNNQQSSNHTTNNFAQVSIYNNFLYFENKVIIYILFNNYFKLHLYEVILLYSI